MIGTGTSTHTAACVVVGCKVTGKPPSVEGRPFVCAKHLGVCNSTSLTMHANAAAKLIELRRLAALPGAPAARQERRCDQVRVYEGIEDRNWAVLFGQVTAKFEVAA